MESEEMRGMKRVSKVTMESVSLHSSRIESEEPGERFSAECSNSRWNHRPPHQFSMRERERDIERALVRERETQRAVRKEREENQSTQIYLLLGNEKRKFIFIICKK